MGADLYIKPIFKPQNDKYSDLFHKACVRRDKAKRGSKTAAKEQQAVSFWYNKMYAKGYFRDSYNCWTMLRTVGLSWWNDVSPLLTKKGELRGKNLKKFRDMVAKAKQKLPSKEQIIKWGGMVEETGEYSLPEIHKYFQEKRQRLIDFLDVAIKNKYPVECSL